MPTGVHCQACHEMETVGGACSDDSCPCWTGECQKWDNPWVPPRDLLREIRETGKVCGWQITETWSQEAGVTWEVDTWLKVGLILRVEGDTREEALLETLKRVERSWDGKS